MCQQKFLHIYIQKAMTQKQNFNFLKSFYMYFEKYFEIIYCHTLVKQIYQVNEYIIYLIQHIINIAKNISSY